ncbi:MAG: hypothetical protein FE041_03785 [Thermoplasmata archaeon]|nr:MAG: hypothetical protein FE041_03785 [Thermoplasmata archaeon]
MKVKCKLIIECKSNKEAKIIHDSLRIDNERFISTRVNGNFIEAEARAKEALSLLHTLNDFLSCLSIAKNLVNIF